MTLPRFYEIELCDNKGAQRCLAINLLDNRKAVEASALVRNIAGIVKSTDRSHRARTAYVQAPTPGAMLQPSWAYAWGDGTANTARLGRHVASLCQGLDVHRFTARTGSWVEGPDLVGREDILASLCTKLGSGGRVHLMAPRRYGKTSMLRAAQERLAGEGRTVIRIDVESVESIAALTVRLVDETFLSTDVLRGVEELQGWPQPGVSPPARIEACRLLLNRIRSSPATVLARVCNELAGARAIILADEFTRFILETIQGEHRSLFVRALSAIATTPGLAIMVCGSQGLRGFVDWHDLQPLRGLESVAVGPLQPEIARILVEELFYGEGHPPVTSAVQAVLDAVGAPVPFFLHGLVHHAVQEHRSRAPGSRTPIDTATVQRAYERRLLDQEGNEFFRAFRLKERGYPDQIRAAAATILHMLAQSPDAIALSALRARCELSEESFELLLAALVEDYDIVQSDAGICFRSKVMRERWARREAWLRGGVE